MFINRVHDLERLTVFNLSQFNVNQKKMKVINIIFI